MRPPDAAAVGAGPRPSPPAAREHAGGARADEESEAWLAALRGEDPGRERAIERLHALLLRAARFEVARRRPALPHLRGGDLDDVAVQSADDALVAVLRKLDDYRGESRFTTWVYKFALLEAAVNLRRRAWQGREVPLEPATWPLVADGAAAPHHDVEVRELLRAVQAAVEDDLTPHQREIFTALALNDVPIDVLAERLATTRGALYKTLHDARRKLRSKLAERGLAPNATEVAP